MFLPLCLDLFFHSEERIPQRQHEMTVLLEQPFNLIMWSETQGVQILYFVVILLHQLLDLIFTIPKALKDILTQLLGSLLNVVGPK